ncbi:MAG: class I SAM-dependent methyltransferase [Planctomycetes bacterium]|nr:class I SAM-dependent methyltransferase [Planctomycetota bacterium]
MTKDAFLKVSGHLYPDEGYLLQRLAEGKRVLELGSHHGRSAVAMAATAIFVETVDNFLGDSQIGAPNLAETIFNITESQLGHKIDLFTADFVEFLNDCEIEEYNCLFYDASHTPPVYEKDFLDFIKGSKFKGIVALHDYKPDEHEMRYVVEAVDDFEKETGLAKQGPLPGTSIVWFELV